MSIKDQNVLVTGGAGFVGSYVVDRLTREKPRSITVASNFFLGDLENLIEARENFPALKIRRCDVADYEDIYETVTEDSIDVVFNLSVIPLPTSLVKPEWTIRKNIDMTLNVCRLLRENKFKTLIQFSSSEAVGTARIVPMKEDHPLDPVTPYAASKAATDHIALSYHHTFGCDVSIIRPFNQYGPRQNARKYAGIIPIMIGKMIKNEDITIHGDGEQTRDFLYASDTANAAIEACKNTNTRGKILNVASGKELSINYLVKTIAEKLGYTKEFHHAEPRIGDVRRHSGDPSQIKQLTGWEPKVSFEEGIEKTIRWYKDNPNRFL